MPAGITLDLTQHELNALRRGIVPHTVLNKLRNSANGTGAQYGEEVVKHFLFHRLGACSIPRELQGMSAAEVWNSMTVEDARWLFTRLAILQLISPEDACGAGQTNCYCKLQTIEEVHQHLPTIPQPILQMLEESRQALEPTKQKDYAPATVDYMLRVLLGACSVPNRLVGLSAQQAWHAANDENLHWIMYKLRIPTPQEYRCSHPQLWCWCRLLRDDGQKIRAACANRIPLQVMNKLAEAQDALDAARKAESPRPL